MTDIHIPGNHEIETFTGRYIDVKNPQPEDISLTDIAHALSNTCRYGGHSRDFYSVAEHAVLCAWYVQEKYEDTVLALGALHHDDSEFALGDIPRPIKSLLGPAYRHLTDLMDRAIAVGLNLPVIAATEQHGAIVREADNWALLQEAERLLPSQGRGWSEQAVNWDLDDGDPGDVIDPPAHFAFSLRPHAAEGLYIHTHNALIAELKEA